MNLKELNKGEYLGRQLRSFENRLMKLCITAYDPSDKIIRHYHCNPYISMLIKGSYEEGGHRLNQQVKPGDVLLRPAYYEHDNTFGPGEGRCFNIELKDGWENQLLPEVKFPNKFNYYKGDVFPSIYRLLTELMHPTLPGFIDEHLINALLDIQPCHLGRGKQSWLVKAKEILEQELEVFHSLHSLSERVYVHPVYLARVFKERTGFTIGEYQLRSKLNRAKQLLINSNLTITEISVASGFFDTAHFIRTFAKVYGYTPKKFRSIINS